MIEIVPIVILFLHTGSVRRLNDSVSTRSASDGQSVSDDDRRVHNQKVNSESTTDDDNEQVTSAADESYRADTNSKVIVVREASDDNIPEVHISGQVHHDRNWNNEIASSDHEHNNLTLSIQKEDICENSAGEADNVRNSNSGEKDEDDLSEIGSAENNAEFVEPEGSEIPGIENVACAYSNSTESKDGIEAAHDGALFPVDTSEGNNNFSNASSIRTHRHAGHSQNGMDNETRKEIEQDTSRTEEVDGERDMEYLEDKKHSSYAINLPSDGGQRTFAPVYGDGGGDHQCISGDDDHNVDGDGDSATGENCGDGIGSGTVTIDDGGGGGDGNDESHSDVDVDDVGGGGNDDGFGVGGDGDSDCNDGDDENDRAAASDDYDLLIRSHQHAGHSQNGMENETREEDEQDTKSIEQVDGERDMEYLEDKKHSGYSISLPGYGGQRTSALVNGDDGADRQSISGDDDHDVGGDDDNATGENYVDDDGIGSGTVIIDDGGGGDGNDDSDSVVDVDDDGGNDDGFGAGGDGDYDGNGDSDSDSDTNNNYGEGVGGGSPGVGFGGSGGVGDGLRFAIGGDSAHENYGICGRGDVEEGRNGGNDGNVGNEIDVSGTDYGDGIGGASGHYTGDGDGDDSGASGEDHPLKPVQHSAEKDGSVLTAEKENLKKG